MDADASASHAPISNGIDAHSSAVESAGESVSQAAASAVGEEKVAIASSVSGMTEPVSTPIPASAAAADAPSEEVVGEPIVAPPSEAAPTSATAQSNGETVQSTHEQADNIQHRLVEEGQEVVAETQKEEMGEDGEEDMNVGSDDFDTPPPAKDMQTPATAPAPAQAPAPSSLPAPPLSAPEPAIPLPTSKPAANTANDDAATAFLKKTFDSFSKPNPPTTAQHDPEQYRNSLKARLEKDPRDGEAWLALINDTNGRADLQEMRRVYEDFFAVFPNAARQWQDYAALELSHSEFQNVESIFTRCLRSTPSTDLWRSYLSYTRRVNPLPPPSKGYMGTEESEREKVRKVIEGAYDFALRFIGQSRDSGEVWREYISLLKEREAGNQWQSGQKMDDIRRAYQRAVAVPLANVELLWREYDAYENGLNRITAKKFLAERSPAYMTARTVFREMRTLTDGLYRPIVPKVPSWAAPPSLSPLVSPLTIARDRSQVEAWKKYLVWEEGNPLQLDDVATLQSRVLMAYRKATMHLRFFPEVWYMAASYARQSDRLDEAANWLKSGMEACTGSFLLHFAYIEQAEARAEVQDCGEVFNSLIEWVYGQIEALQSNLDAEVKAINEEGERIKAEASARRRHEGAADVVEGEEREELRKMEEERERRREAEREKVRPKIEEMKEHASLVWIKYMHFVRRQEGQRPSRAIFARARKSKYCTWQAYEANALMEYHCSKEVSVATKVFELALKTYGDDEAFVVRYLDFLLSINDDNNARALFERTVGSFAPERARPIWDRWSEYEYSFGDAASIAKIDERLAQVYPAEASVKRLVDRNSYMDLDVVGPRDLGLRTVIGGASAADRAVAASREIAQEAAGSLMMHVPTGPSGRSFGGEEEQPPIKRARFAAGREGNSPIPSAPAAARGLAPPGARGMKRSVSPPSRFVPPPRGEPLPPQQLPQQPQQPPQPPPPAYIEVPDAIMFFLDCLPNVASFDGPRFPAEEIIESLMRSSLPTPELNKSIPSGPGGSQGGGRSGRRRSGRGRRH